MFASIFYVTRSSRPLLSKAGLAILIFKAGRVQFKELMYLISVAGMGRDNLETNFLEKKKRATSLTRFHRKEVEVQRLS